MSWSASLNLSRGLLRLWLVLGVVWVLGVGFANRDLIVLPTSEMAKKECQLSDYYQLKKAGFKDSEIESYKTEYIRRMGSRIPECLKEIEAIEAENRKVQIGALSKIVLPPLFMPLLLATAWVLVKWIKKGFSKEE